MMSTTESTWAMGWSVIFPVASSCSMRASGAAWINAATAAWSTTGVISGILDRRDCFAAARAAAKQSRRSRIPEITPVVDQAAVAALIQAAPLALMLHEDATGKITDQPMAQVDSVVLIIGPEGGISPAELDAFTTAGAHLVRLGPEVLRTASAGMVALAALGAVTDRW